MAIAKSGGVTTEVSGVQESAPEQAAPDSATTEHTVTLQPNEVELGDGRVVRLRRTTALDDTEIDSIVFDWKANDLGVVPPTIALRAQALNAVSHIDGKEQMLIASRDDLRLRMSKFSSDDMDLIGDKYYEIQGKKKKMLEAIREAQQAIRSGGSF